MHKSLWEVLLLGGIASLFVALSVRLGAETGAGGWLRYAPPPNSSRYASIPRSIVVLGSSAEELSAAAELSRGLSRMLARREEVLPIAAAGHSIVIGTVEQFRASNRAACSSIQQPGEGFCIHRSRRQVLIQGGSPAGVLYGAFHLLGVIAQNQPLPEAIEQSPATAIRWVNQWDNLDGTIERGYAGRSIFFDNGHVRSDLARAGDYARLLASVGINGVTVNNVNGNPGTLTPEMIDEIARIADVFRPWGVRLSLSVDLSSPKAIGGLATFDPLNAEVEAWWQRKIEAIYRVIPDFGGFVVKADSEGMPGPSQYGRSPAEAANVLARPLQAHGGIVLYRGFVYNHHLDWNDLKADRARAGYDNFRSLDGKFAPNVVIQVKLGPIDFQVREPVSPLFGALQHTSQAIELQVTQEYTGQQRHMVFLVPMWKCALETDLRVGDRSTPLREIVAGESFHQPLGGFVGVANVGLDTNWLHHPMAMANLYGYGRLAWNARLTSEQIVEEWTRMTWGNGPMVVRTIDKLQLQSWKTYENYTGPLGAGGLTDIIGIHYGPGIESAERNGWGQWIRADHVGIGMDRTVATGTGFIGQYPPALAAQYESAALCPDELLLFMHHVPYTHLLHSGKTVIQFIYDSHYQGAAAVASYVPQWQSLRGMIDRERYGEVLRLFNYQAGHAEVWRDAVNDWFYRISGVRDDQDRVGHHAGRVEAESAEARGYEAVDVTPWETASGGKAVVCLARECSIRSVFRGRPGTYFLHIGYFDLRTGTSRFDLLVNGRPVAAWAADDVLPPAFIDEHLDGHTATRFTRAGVRLSPGDIVEVRGAPGGAEPAPLDFIQIVPEMQDKLPVF